MRSWLRVLLIFLILLAVSFVTYYYALADTPRRDHPGYLAERALVETDWDWFWYSVSYSRTRFLHPGDSYLFRPLHMAVLALKDIFFRNNLFALGFINITLMAVAAFSLYFFSSRLLKPATAFIVAVLFMVQYAGLEIVAWGHITSYLLALTFVGFAMGILLQAGPNNNTAPQKAGALLLLGSLTHEMTAIALVLAAPLLIFLRWRGGREASIGRLPLRNYIIWVIVTPLFIYLGLDLLDYLYRGAPQLLGPSNDIASSEKSDPLVAILSAAGTAATAFIAPFMVELTKGETGILAWDFGSMRPVIVTAGVILTLAILYIIYICIRALKTRKGSEFEFTSLLAVLLLAGVILGVGLGRIHSRGESYFYEATYYYSITAYIFCLLIAVSLYHLNKAEGTKVPRLISRAVLVAMLVLITINFARTRETLEKYWPEKKKFAQMHLALDETLDRYSGRYCLAGSAAYADVSLRILWKRTCKKGDRRIPGYLANGEDGSLWLVELEAEPVGAFGKPEEVSLLKLAPNLMLSRDSYERPDISLSVNGLSHVFLLFEYQNFSQYSQIELYGPLLHGEIVTGAGKSPLTGYVGLPFVDSPQRLELRHGANLVYVFADGHLVASAPIYNSAPGKIGIYVKEMEGDIDNAFSDFLVAPSAPRGMNSVDFKEVARLLENSEVVFPEIISRQQ